MRATRVGHKKSRNGCVRCKKRHVKCDERRPCHNCHRHGAECSLVQQPAVTPSIHANLTPQATPSSDGTGSFRADRSNGGLGETPAPSLLSPGQYDAPPRSPSVQTKAANITKLLRDLTEEVEALEWDPSGSDHAPPQQQTAFLSEPPRHVSMQDWMEDLSLLHHYFSSSYRSLVTSESHHDLWRYTVPKIAFSYDFLMHGLLALSALHYGHVNPDKDVEFHIIATRHQNMALDLFTSQLHNVNEENCHAFILLSSFIFKINAIGIAESHRRGKHITTDDVAQSLMLGQGVRSILSLPSAWQWAESGPLSSLLNGIDPVPHPTGEFITQIDNLLGLTRAISCSPDSIDVRSSCLLAIESLRHTYATMLAENTRPGRVWMWPITAPPRFLELIGTGHPVALVILAHYCALIRCSESALWGLEGWSDGVMAAVDYALSESWKVWIEWPMRCLREHIDLTSTNEHLF